MNELEASDALEMLLRDFYYLKFEEFLLIFRMMKEGKFDTFYERLKAAEFTRCFEEFDKMEARSTMWESKHKTKTIEPLDKITEAMYKEAIENLKKPTKSDGEAEYLKIKLDYDLKGLQDSE